MPGCVFRKCKNYGQKVNKDAGITYHTFPSDEITKHKWIKIVQAERNEHDYMPSPYHRICSVHFDKEDFYTTEKGYVRLKKIAVPVFQSNEVLGAVSPSSLDSNINLADIEMMNRVRKLTFEKKELQKKNNILKNQNNRLKKGLTRMKNIVKILKQKKILTEELFLELTGAQAVESTNFTE